MCKEAAGDCDYDQQMTVDWKVKIENIAACHKLKLEIIPGGRPQLWFINPTLSLFEDGT